LNSFQTGNMNIGRSVGFMEDSMKPIPISQLMIHQQF
jgi:hypothetical protein